MLFLKELEEEDTEEMSNIILEENKKEYIKNNSTVKQIKDHIFIMTPTTGGHKKTILYKSSVISKQYDNNNQELPDTTIIRGTIDDINNLWNTFEKEEDFNPLQLPSIEDLENLDLGDMNFKIASLDYTGKLWNIKEGQKWLKDKFGQEAVVLTQEEINDMADRLGYVAERGGMNLWGFVHNATVYIAENAAAGTQFHEGFHVIFNSALSTREKKALLEYGDEEWLSDQFAEYIITQKNPKKGLSRIFKKIYLFLKNILAINKMTLDEFFWMYENSTYRNIKFKKNVDIFRPKKSGVHPTTVKRRVRLINKFFFEELEELRKENPNLKNEDLFKLALGERSLYGTKVLDRIKNLQQHIENNWQSDVYQDVKVGDKTFTGEQIYKARKAQAKQLEDLFYKDGKPQEWYNTALEDLRNYGIFVNTIGGKETIENEEDGLELWMKENVKSPAFDSFTFELKKMLNDIPEVEYVTFKDKDKPNVIEYLNPKGKPVYIKRLTDDFGQSIYMDGTEVYSKLLQFLTNSMTQKDMMSKLEDMSIDYAWAKVLYDELSNESNNFLKGDLGQLKNQMYNKFASWHNTQSIVITPSQNGELRLSFSNERGLVRNMVKDWWSFIDSPANPLYQNEDKQKKTVKVLNSLKTTVNEAKVGDIQALNKTLNALGITSTESMVKRIVDENSGTKLRNVLIQVVEGSKIGVEELAKLIKKNYPEYYQPSHINVEGELVQNHIRASFLARQIERFRRSEGMDIYEDDSFYNSSYDPSQQFNTHALWIDRLKPKRTL